MLSSGSALMACYIYDGGLKRKRQEEEDDDVSTELSHWLDYQPIEKKPRTTMTHHRCGTSKYDEFLTSDDDVSSTTGQGLTRDFLSEIKANNNNASMIMGSYLSPSTELQLYSDPWNIKKSLKKSDLDGLSRLLIPKSLVKRHVLSSAAADVIQKVESNKGLSVGVWDVDTDSVHQLVFKHWRSSGAYILAGNWCRYFVKRRDLKLGDHIALFWNPYLPGFAFRVLDRSNN